MLSINIENANVALRKIIHNSCLSIRTNFVYSYALGMENIVKILTSILKLKDKRN